MNESDSVLAATMAKDARWLVRRPPAPQHSRPVGGEGARVGVPEEDFAMTRIRRRKLDNRAAAADAGPPQGPRGTVRQRRAADEMRSRSDVCAERAQRARP